MVQKMVSRGQPRSSQEDWPAVTDAQMLLPSTPLGKPDMWKVLGCWALS